MIFGGVWLGCGLRVDIIHAESHVWTCSCTYGFCREDSLLFTCDCGFHVVLVGSLGVHVCLEPCIVHVDCMEPTVSVLYFTWFSLSRVWWVWTFVTLMESFTDCKNGVRGEFDYLGNVLSWCRIYVDSRGIVDCVDL